MIPTNVVKGLLADLEKTGSEFALLVNSTGQIGLIWKSALAAGDTKMCYFDVATARDLARALRRTAGYVEDGRAGRRLSALTPTPAKTEPEA